MHARAILRVALLGVGIMVLGLVAYSWEPRPGRDVRQNAAEVADEPTLPTGEGDAEAPSEGMVSDTRDLRHTEMNDGVMLYRLQAGRRIGFEGGFNIFADPVELVIYGEAQTEGLQPAETQVEGQRLEAREVTVPRGGDRFQEVRVLDDVHASLSGRIELTTDLLVYANGRLSTDAGVRLGLAGLIIEAANFRYDPKTETGQLRGAYPESPGSGSSDRVRLRTARTGAAEADSGAVLEGEAGNLVYDRGLSELQLGNAPEVDLPQASLRGGEIAFTLAPDGTSVRGIEARRAAQAVWLESTAPGDHLLTGALIVAELDGNGTPIGLRAEGEEDRRPRFELGESGTLRGDVIELSLRESDAGGIAARGDAYFRPSDARGLESIGGQVLRVGREGAQELVADGSVEVRFSTPGGESVALRGARASFSYRDGALLAADWGAGIRYEDTGRTIDAAKGSYDAETESWVLSGIPRPRLRTEEYDIEADEMILRVAGAVQMSGDVTARLGGDIVRPLGAVFGGAMDIEAAADMLEATTDGRLRFRSKARITQGTQLLQAGSLIFLPASGEIEATEGVLAILTDEQAAGPEIEGPRTLQLLGESMAISGSPPELRLVGNATLEGATRTIQGDLITMRFREAGGWETIDVSGNVTMEDPAGTVRGETLSYDAASGVVVVMATAGTPASFTNQQGIDIRDPEGLRLQWSEGSLSVLAMQKGTTQTVRSGGG